MTGKLHITFLRILSAVMSVVCAFSANAFDLSHYVENSVLASGKWVKIGVAESGLYKISSSTLSSWGFNDISKVRIYGYGGNRINDILSKSNYIDDLPPVDIEILEDGVVFYGLGPDTWKYTYTNTYYYHKESSPYTTMGYYFITESEDTEVEEIPFTGIAGVGDASSVGTQVQARVHYEEDLVLASEAGPLMVGEDFLYTPSRQFTIETPGRVAGTEVLMECQFVSRHVGATGMLRFTVDGKTVETNSSDKISSTSDSHYVHASIGVARHSLVPEAEASFTLGITHSSSASVGKANLDYLSFTYTRDLTLPETGTLSFWSKDRALSMKNAVADMRVWDVTVPESVSSINFSLSADNSAQWQPSYSSYRNYIAWTPSAQLPEPEFVENVENQNLHAQAEPVEMVIFTTPILEEQARRIASLHENTDSLRVSVVDANKVYNEFSSGVPDVSGLRKYLKMVYDRGLDSEKPLRYAILLGRTTLDHRKILQSSKASNITTMPVWVVKEARQSMSDNDGFTTDDFMAMLEDDSGSDFGIDHLSIAVGRIPMTSAHDGKEIVDKLYQYVNSSKRTGWKNRIMVLADDEDQGVHLRQIESMVSNILATNNQQHLIEKVYMDSYILSSGEYPDARRDMFQGLEEGVTWWIFAGHANNHSWTGEGQLTYTDINNMYLRNLPFLVAATCDFLRWDSETESGGEIMYKERYGGSIGMISATRPVYISDNGYFLEALGRALLARKDGKLPTAGEVYQNAKNDIRNSKGDHVSNTNRLRFVFMGDPAMKIVSPNNIVEVQTINGQAPELESQVTIAAMSNATITGRVLSPMGEPLTDFNGTVTVEIYDALKSVTTYGHGDGEENVFDTQGDKLYVGAAAVVNGEFTIKVAMPSVVADNFRPATMMLYAAASNSNAEAIGANREFYVYGFEEPAEADTIAPTISLMALNHAAFNSGDVVNSAPLLIAEVSDNVGLNLSQTGIGQQITATIDGTDSYNDLSAYYTPFDDPQMIGGVINYVFENLTEGAHTMRLRVFDTSGNAAEKSIDFFVDESQSPQIFDVYTDANPASVEANFYVKHDRPENIVEVQIEVFDLLGHPIWSGVSKGMSDMYTSTPVTWNLTDFAGRRVPRGIYLYRASITTDNENYQSSSRRIAVTAQ